MVGEALMPLSTNVHKRLLPFITRLEGEWICCFARGW